MVDLDLALLHPCVCLNEKARGGRKIKLFPVVIDSKVILKRWVKSSHLCWNTRDIIWNV